MTDGARPAIPTIQAVPADAPALPAAPVASVGEACLEPDVVFLQEVSGKYDYHA